MQTLLSKLWKIRANRAKRDDKGFTLIELLVVVVILGVLIAIAIPVYLNYRKGANDASAQSDLRNSINVLEQCNSTNTTYPTSTFTLTASGAPGTAAAPAGCPTQMINLSSGTSLTYTPVTSPVGYVIVDTNSSGTPKYYCYNSTVGGSVKTISPTTSTLAAAVTLGC